jgi:hypothetical protein
MKFVRTMSEESNIVRYVKKYKFNNNNNNNNKEIKN